MELQDKANKNLKKTIEGMTQTRRHSASQGTVDGFTRDPKDEHRLNELAYATFASAQGQQFLNYLRQITVNHPLGPEVTDSALRHKEGMRYLFGLIYSRFEKGKNHDR